MLQMTLAGHYYSLRCLLFCYLFLRITALNETDHQTNETIIEFNSTLINPISRTSDSYEVNATVIVPTDNVTDSSTIADVSTVFTILNSTVSFTSPVYNATDTTLLDITTVVSSSQSESIENNTTPVYTSVFTTESSNRQSTDVANTSCEASKYGCCADGITVRDGPDNEGCADDQNSTVIYSNTTEINNVTDVISTEEPDSTTQVAEETNEAISTDISAEETTIVYASTESTVFDDNTTAVESDNTTAAQSIVESTTESVETTTVIETTVAVPTTCADSKFQCCSDGIIPAQGPQFEGCNTTEKWTAAAAKSNVTLKTVCELEKDAGSCSKYVNMWAYDQQQGKCIRFWYGSCEGNGNRFETEQHCQETCVSPKGIEVCLLPKITGPCQSTGIRYYYDRDKKECQQFRYGGCNGNANNYETIEQCQSACEQATVDQCTQPAEAGPCKGEHARFFYDTVTGQCRSFTYGGCQKNENHFSTLKDCLKVCVGSREREICLQPKVVGTCQERRPTWYFDLTAQECKLFQYSGCKGNHNRFASKEECDLSCASLRTSKTLDADRKAICKMPMIRGDCDQQISRWYFNPADQYCHPFQYTGCHGNANAFETEQDCRELCQAKEKDVCTLDKDTGSCDQYKIMWYYDASSQQCKNFYYGSCGGNGNRFGTEQECQIGCLIKAGNSTCEQQVDQGHGCNDTKGNRNETASPVMKFFYDQQLKKCSSFLYHGCGGNDNRFDEENQCTEKCVVETPTAEQGCGSNMIRCNIQCRFGFERDASGCEICRCFEPCQRQPCPSGYTCVIIPEQVPCLQAPCPVPRVECQPMNGDQPANADGGIKPLIENSITNIFSQFDANVTIPCTLRQGYPTPVIYWYKERQQLQVHEAMSGGIIVRKIERLPDQSLLIRKITLEDQGLYTCRAINSYGQDINDVQLDIFDPIKVDIYPINRIYQLGFAAKLQCKATGYPMPRVIWMRDHVPLTNSSRVTLQNDGSLIIHPYNREDAGPYVCNATNKKESVTQVAYLEVKEMHVEPTCEDQPTFANCELVLRHNFCDVYFDYCCRTCSQHAPHLSPSSDRGTVKSRRHLLWR